MATVRKTITLTDQQDDGIKAQVIQAQTPPHAWLNSGSPCGRAGPGGDPEAHEGTNGVLSKPSATSTC